MYCLKVTIVPLVDTDDMFAFNVGLRYKIVIQKCCICMQLLLLDKIKLHLPRMQCKSEALGKWHLNLDYFLMDKKMAKNTLYNRARGFKIGE